MPTKPDPLPALIAALSWRLDAFISEPGGWRAVALRANPEGIESAIGRGSTLALATDDLAANIRAGAFHTARNYALASYKDKLTTANKDAGNALLAALGISPPPTIQPSAPPSKPRRLP